MPGGVGPEVAVAGAGEGALVPFGAPPVVETRAESSKDRARSSRTHDSTTAAATSALATIRSTAWPFPVVDEQPNPRGIGLHVDLHGTLSRLTTPPGFRALREPAPPRSQAQRRHRVPRVPRHPRKPRMPERREPARPPRRSWSY